jgi:hypothetical protein
MADHMLATFHTCENVSKVPAISQTLLQCGGPLFSCANFTTVLLKISAKQMEGAKILYETTVRKLKCPAPIDRGH